MERRMGNGTADERGFLGRGKSESVHESTRICTNEEGRDARECGGLPRSHEGHEEGRAGFAIGGMNGGSGKVVE